MNKYTQLLAHILLEPKIQRSAEQSLAVFLDFAQVLMEQKSIEDLLWYVAEEVVQRMGFIDCVIYRFNPVRDNLQQFAAIGDKNIARRKISNPLIIELGEGVTGTVAQKKSPLLLKDSKQFPGYIVDLMEPGSELCVPILNGTELLGVIDCEHPDKNWFVEADLDLLLSIASLTASQWMQCSRTTALHQQARLLELAEERADASNKAKSVFLANMSHEIRTPLHGILSTAQMLSKTELDGEQKELTAILKSSSDVLLQLVEDILDISQIESGQMLWHPTHTDIEKLVRERCALFANQESNLELNIEFAPNLPRFVITDGKRFGQLVNNLVSNAAKYTHEGSITVTVSVMNEIMIRVKVQDTGVGIAEEEKEAIFDRFVRSKSDYKNLIQGTGIGLSLSYDIVRLGGGTIGFESELDQGSTFWFELPLIESSGPVQNAQSKPNVGAEHHEGRLLVVDDNQVNRMVAAKFLGKNGFTVDTGKDGVEAVEAALAHNYDAIILDVRMPNKSGDEALQEIRASNAWNKKVPILILTGDATIEVQKELLDKGATAFFTKPLQMDALLTDLTSRLES